VTHVTNEALLDAVHTPSRANSVPAVANLRQKIVASRRNLGLVATNQTTEETQMRKHTQIQMIVAVLSFAVAAAIASTAPSTDADEIQSFVGTAPNAANVESLPPTF
jgi:hypothetical protein